MRCSPCRGGHDPQAIGVVRQVDALREVGLAIDEPHGQLLPADRDLSVLPVQSAGHAPVDAIDVHASHRGVCGVRHQVDQVVSTVARHDHAVAIDHGQQAAAVVVHHALHGGLICLEDQHAKGAAIAADACRKIEARLVADAAHHELKARAQLHGLDEVLAGAKARAQGGHRVGMGAVGHRNALGVLQVGLPDLEVLHQLQQVLAHVPHGRRGLELGLQRCASLGGWGFCGGHRLGEQEVGQRWLLGQRLTECRQRSEMGVDAV